MTRDDAIAFIKQNHERSVFGALGIVVESFEPSKIIVALDVDHRHLQHTGIVHGGIYVLLAESAASIAGALTVDLAKVRVAGMEINANHIKSVTAGKICAAATLLHHGKITMVYSIDVTDSDGDLVCVSRCTLAVVAL